MFRNPVFWFGLLFLLILTGGVKGADWRSVKLEYKDSAGKRHEISLPFGENHESRAFQLEFGSEATPLGRQFGYSLIAREEVVLESFTLNGYAKPEINSSFFRNGLLSESNSRERDRELKPERVSSFLQPFSTFGVDYPWNLPNIKKDPYLSWTYTYLRRHNGTILLIGSLDEASGFSLLRFDFTTGAFFVYKDCLGLRPEPGEKTPLLNLMEAEGSEEAVFAEYGRLHKDLNSLPEQQPLPSLSGWAMRHPVENVLSDSILHSKLSNLDSLHIPFDIFQIGYQQAIDDGLPANARFPGGLKAMADSIHEAGFKAGIWLTPFICEEKSDLFRDHPDWILRDKKGKKVKAGSHPNGGGDIFALDIYNPGLQEYLKHCFEVVLDEWGFDMVKLDLLYAACILPANGRSRGGVMSDAVDMLREWTGDKLILGRGVPMGSAFGKVDFCQVGSDSQAGRDHKARKQSEKAESMPGLNALTGTLGRWQLSGNFFGNAPETLMLDDRDQAFTSDERYSQLLMNTLLGDLVFISDEAGSCDSLTLDLYRTSFPAREKEILEVVRLGKLFQIRFKIEEREYLAFCNLGEEEAIAYLPDETFFDGRSGRSFRSRFITLKPHAAICLYFMEREAGKAEVLGAPNSLFPGAEVEEFFQTEAGAYSLKLHSDAPAGREIWIRLPAGQTAITLNGVQYASGMGIISVPGRPGYRVLRFIP